ncbi:FAD-binding protein [bacterium]|nr:FAD-binding protein [bacterium]
MLLYDQVRDELRRRLPSEVLVDRVRRGIYATDASLYQFEPIAVVTPRSEADIAIALEIARRHRIAVLPRGGGTSLAGQATNSGIVLDVSKHMNRVLEINPSERWARVQPGVVRDELNAQLKPHGLEFAPETSTSNRANIGGMIGNNSSGMRSIQYGRTSEHVIACRVMLASGEFVELRQRSPQEVADLIAGDSIEGRLLRGIGTVLDRHRELIEARFPKVMRRVGGYSLDEFALGQPWNLAKLICGAEGTLAVMLEATVAISEPPEHVAAVAIHFVSMDEALRAVPQLLAHDPLSVELMDGELIRLSQNNPSTRDLCGFIEGRPEAMLVVELSAESDEALKAVTSRLTRDLSGNAIGYANPVIVDAVARARLTELRRKSLGVMLAMPGDEKPVPFIEDACVPPERLAEYLPRVVQICAQRGIRTLLYGHASVGVVHVRPVMNMKRTDHREMLEPIARETMQMVKEFGGSWSGEHGDGISRGALNEEFWGPEMIEAFRETKRVFDPDGLMNPGRIFDTPAIGENQRFGPHYNVRLPETFFRFSEMRGFAGAIEMCNGVGACRKTGEGTMCPSYMATRDEEHTTRGRANALRLAISGQLGPKGLGDKRLHEVLDLCLECKACKTECPSNVDMARLKSEFLAHWHAKYGKTLRERLFAEAPRSGALFSGGLAPFANAALKSSIIRRQVLDRLGIATERTLPKFARQPLRDWFMRRREHLSSDAPRVALFGDCWASYHETGPARLLVRVLAVLGYRVELISGACCQRTRISKGFLDAARRDGARTVETLAPYAEEGVPVLVLEPSCLSALKDDLPDLVPNRMTAQQVARNAFGADDFLVRTLEASRLRPRFQPILPEFLIHGHCHQKALETTNATRRLLELTSPGKPPVIREVDSGCCGMAGSFGYEAEHYEISNAIGERRLLPAVREANDRTIIVANGFSCRHQIADGTGRYAMHVVEAFGRTVFGRWHR